MLLLILRLMLQKKIDCRQPTDIWLSQLIEEMCRAIKNYMRRALKEDISLNEYAFSDYASTIELVSVARFNVLWTTSVEQMFNSNNPMIEIKSVYQNLTTKVATLCKEVIHVIGNKVRLFVPIFNDHINVS